MTSSDTSLFLEQITGLQEEGEEKSEEFMITDVAFEDYAISMIVNFSTEVHSLTQIFIIINFEF